MKDLFNAFTDPIIIDFFIFLTGFWFTEYVSKTNRFNRFDIFTKYVVRFSSNIFWSGFVICMTLSVFWPIYNLWEVFLPGNIGNIFIALLCSIGFSYIILIPKKINDKLP